MVAKIATVSWQIIVPKTGRKPSHSMNNVLKKKTITQSTQNHLAGHELEASTLGASADIICLRYNEARLRIVNKKKFSYKMK